MPVLIEYRPFLNSDAPLVAEIWRNQTPLRAVTPVVTPAILEDHVFSKLYFDRRGLIVAEEHSRLVGFVHAGFAPNEDGSDISTTVGSINLLMTLSRPDRVTIGRQLFRHAEQYLYDRGAKSLRAGSVDATGPYYLGFYGGSQLPGVMAGDETWLHVVAESGYQKVEHRLVFQRKLGDFRPPVDRPMMQARRRSQLSVESDPTPRSWWEACTTGNLNRTRFNLSSKMDGKLTAEATFWDIQPLASHWGMSAMGLLKIEMSDTAQQQGWETFLLAESLRQLQQAGTAMVEIQVSGNDGPRIDLLRRLDFEEVDQGIAFEKPSTDSKAG